MSKMIQIRNVPAALHRKLKARAAVAGKSLSDYLLAEIGRIAALPTREEMLARIHRRSRVELKVPAADVIRREREFAEVLDAPLVTCDGPLGAAPGVVARVEVIR